MAGVHFNVMGAGGNILRPSKKVSALVQLKYSAVQRLPDTGTFGSLPSMPLQLKATPNSLTASAAQSQLLTTLCRFSRRQRRCDLLARRMKWEVLK